jgi:hypothetical protein
LDLINERLHVRREAAGHEQPTSNFLAAAYRSALSRQVSKFFRLCVHCAIT